MWFLRPSAPATILQSYDQNISYLSGKPAQNIGHKRFFSTSAASIASNYIIPPADLPRAFAPARLLTKSYEARLITTTEERNDNAKDDLFGRSSCDCRCDGGLRLVAFDADPIAAARDGSRGGVDDIADRDDDQLQEAAASGAVGRVLRFTEGPINPGI
jgi:hypothetical protein